MVIYAFPTIKYMKTWFGYPTATATVTDSFEDDFTTLMTHGSTGVDFKWSTNKVWFWLRCKLQVSDVLFENNQQL